MNTVARQNEKNEKELRAILKEEGNKRCMTCTQRMPNNCVFPFGTFVCNACSGVHREYQFRIKSVANSTFKPEEMEIMRQGGNDAARARWLANWFGTEHEHNLPLPTNTNQNALRKFIRTVFVEEKFKADQQQQQQQQQQQPQQQQPQQQQPQQQMGGMFAGIQMPQRAPQVQAPAAPANDPFGLGGFDSPAAPPAPQQPPQQAASDPFGLGGAPAAAPAPAPAPAGGGWDAFGVGTGARTGARTRPRSRGVLYAATSWRFSCSTHGGIGSRTIGCGAV